MAHPASSALEEGGTMHQFVFEGLSKIVKASSRKHRDMRTAASSVLEHLKSRTPFQIANDHNADKYFLPFKLACETESSKLMEISLDYIEKLIAYRYLQGSSLVDHDVYFPRQGAGHAHGASSRSRTAALVTAGSTSTSPRSSSRTSGGGSGGDSGASSPRVRERKRLIDVVIDTIYECSQYENDRVQLQVIKAILTAVTSTSCKVHGQSLLNAVRACYHIFLTTRNQINQTTAKATLTQMLNIVFQRMEHFGEQLRRIEAEEKEQKGKEGNGENSASAEPSAGADSPVNGDVDAAAAESGADSITADRVRETMSAIDQDVKRAIAASVASELTQELIHRAVALAEGQLSRKLQEEEEEKKQASNTGAAGEGEPKAVDSAGGGSSQGNGNTANGGVPGRFGFCVVCEQPANNYCMHTNDAVCSMECKVAHFDEVVHAPDPNRYAEKTRVAAHYVLLQNDAFLLFRALCRLSMKPLPAHPEATIPLSSKVLALELLLSVMDSPGPTFCNGEVFVELVRDQLVMSLLQNSVSTIESVFRLSSSMFVALVRHFRPHLKTEIGVFVDNIYLKILASPNSSYAHKKMALKVLGKLCQHSQTLVEIFLNYDCEIDNLNLFQSIVSQLEKIAQGRFVSKNWMSEEQVRSLRRLALENFGLIMRSLVTWSQQTVAPHQVPHEASSAQHAAAPSLQQRDLQAVHDAQKQVRDIQGMRNGDSFNIEDNMVLSAAAALGPTGSATMRSSLRPQEVAQPDAASQQGQQPVQTEQLEQPEQPHQAPPKHSSPNPSISYSESGVLSPEPQGSPRDGSASTSAGGGGSGTGSGGGGVSGPGTGRGAGSAEGSRPAFSQQFKAQQEMRRKEQIGVVKFNIKPKDGIRFLQREGFIDESPESIIRFITAHPQIDKSALGEFLGREDDFSKTCMALFAAGIDMRSLSFYDALQKYLSGFHLPGEAQIIDRFMERFAERYCADNPGIFRTADVAYVLAYAVIMLHTDMYNPQLKDKMSKEAFVNNTRFIDEEQALDPQFLSDLYDTVRTREIAVPMAGSSASGSSAVGAASGGYYGHDDSSRKMNPQSRWSSFMQESRLMVEQTQELIRKQNPRYQPRDAGPTESTAAQNDSPLDVVRTRRRRAVVPFYEASAADFEAVRPMFDIVWYPVLGTFSILLEEAEDPKLIALCLDGYRFAIRIASVFDIDTARVAFVKSLKQATLLGTQKEMQQKNIEAIKTLLDVAFKEGNHLGQCWGEVLQCISEFERLHLIGSGARPKMDVFEQTSLASGSSGDAMLASGSEGGEGWYADTHWHGYGYEGVHPPQQFQQQRRFPPSMRKIKTQQELHKEQRDTLNSQTLIHQVEASLIDRIFTNSVNLSSEAIVDFVDQLRRISEREMGYDANTGELRSKMGMETPRVFSLQKLVEIAYYNMGRIRLVWSRIWHILTNYFTKAGCHPNLELAKFVIDALRQLAFKFLEKDELSNYQFQKQFLKPFEYIMAKTQSFEIKELIVHCLARMIQSRSSNIKSGWKSVFVVLTLGAKDSRESLVQLTFDVVSSVMKEHFPLVTDTIEECVNCQVGFGENTVTDISLQAIDYLGQCAQWLGEAAEQGSPYQGAASLRRAALSTRRGSYGKPMAGASQNSQQEGAEANSSAPSSPTATTTAAADKSATFEAVEERADMGAWFLVLTGLSRMIGDWRLEVRSRALQVMFKILHTHGGNFDASMWQMIFHGVLFPIFDDVISGRDERRSEFNGGSSDASRGAPRSAIARKRQTQRTRHGPGAGAHEEEHEQEVGEQADGMKSRRSLRKGLGRLGLSRFRRPSALDEGKSHPADDAARSARLSVMSAVEYEQRESRVRAQPHQHRQHGSVSLPRSAISPLHSPSSSMHDFTAESWLRTTCLAALSTLVELFSHFQDKVSFLLPEMLGLIESCIDQDSEELAAIGIKCWVRLLHVSGERFTKAEWTLVLNSLEALFWSTLPHDLCSAHLRRSLHLPPFSVDQGGYFLRALERLTGRVIRPQAAEVADFNEEPVPVEDAPPAAAATANDTAAEGGGGGGDDASQRETSENVDLSIVPASAVESEEQNEPRERSSEEVKEEGPSQAESMEEKQEQGESFAEEEEDGRKGEPSATSAPGEIRQEASEGEQMTAAGPGPTADSESPHPDARGVFGSSVMDLPSIEPSEQPSDGVASQPQTTTPSRRDLPPPPPPPPLPLPPQDHSVSVLVDASQAHKQRPSQPPPPPGAPPPFAHISQQKLGFQQMRSAAEALPFNQPSTIAKCKVQLNLMNALYDVVTHYYDLLGESHVESILRSLLTSVQFARVFNCDLLLRQRLWEAGFLADRQSSPPELFFQESHGLKLYLQSLLRIYTFRSATLKEDTADEQGKLQHPALERLRRQELEEGSAADSQGAPRRSSRSSQTTSQQEQAWNSERGVPVDTSPYADTLPRELVQTRRRHSREFTPFTVSRLERRLILLSRETLRDYLSKLKRCAGAGTAGNDEARHQPPRDLRADVALDLRVQAQIPGGPSLAAQRLDEERMLGCMSPVVCAILEGFSEFSLAQLTLHLPQFYQAFSQLVQWADMHVRVSVARFFATRLSQMLPVESLPFSSEEVPPESDFEGLEYAAADDGGEDDHGEEDLVEEAVAMEVEEDERDEPQKPPIEEEQVHSTGEKPKSRKGRQGRRRASRR